jgi:hypothetical protein
VRVSAAILTVAVDMTTQRLLLILAAVLVGASAGLLGALIFGAVTGMRAKPPRPPAVRMPAPPPAPAPATTRPLRRPLSEPLAAPPAPAPSPFATAGIATAPALYALDGDFARERHRELYDAEYVKQLDHVDALRRTIGRRLALAGEPHTPSEEPDPPEELDA